MRSSIFFEKSGQGPALILIHGFPMDHRVWADFKEDLSESFTVYAPDLPGFGKSDLPQSDFSLRDIAEAMNTWVMEQKIEGAVILGHSLGGYVCLAMAEQNPALFSGMVLFHSTAYADNEEKKQSRTKVLKFIDENGVTAFTSNFIQPLFVDAQHPAIALVRKIAIESSEETVRGYTVAMRDREDRTRVYDTFGKPILILGGEADKGIPKDSLISQSSGRPTTTLYVLKDAAHMGMFEQKQEALEAIRRFVFQISHSSS